MRSSLVLMLTGTLMILGAPIAEAEVTEAERAAQSREVIKSFAARLKSELVGAIKSGGAASAIPVCHTAAPAIAKEKAVEKGWSVGRTALKLRNPDNAPDTWERGVMERFLEQAKQGADLAKLEHFETTMKDGKRVFRYMKAIPVAKPCLTCHGAKVEPSLLKKIGEFYPQDKATGFALGDLRGAFTIVQPLE